MAIPAYLPYGIVSIYGIGSKDGVSGIVPPEGAFFGNVDQVSQYGIAWVKVGDSVLFYENDVQCRLAYANARYTLVQEAKLVIKDYPT